MSNQKLQILSLKTSQPLQILTEQEMLLKGQGDINIEVGGGWFSSSDFSGATVQAFDLPPEYYQSQLQILAAGLGLQQQ